VSISRGCDDRLEQLPSQAGRFRARRRGQGAVGIFFLIEMHGGLGPRRSIPNLPRGLQAGPSRNLHLPKSFKIHPSPAPYRFSVALIGPARAGKREEGERRTLKSRPTVLAILESRDPGIRTISADKKQQNSIFRGTFCYSQQADGRQPAQIRRQRVGTRHQPTEISRASWGVGEISPRSELARKRESHVHAYLPQSRNTASGRTVRERRRRAGVGACRQAPPVVPKPDAPDQRRPSRRLFPSRQTRGRQTIRGHRSRPRGEISCASDRRKKRPGPSQALARGRRAGGKKDFHRGWSFPWEPAALPFLYIGEVEFMPRRDFHPWETSACQDIGRLAKVP